MRTLFTLTFAAVALAGLAACGPQEQVVRPEAAQAAGVAISSVVVRPGSAGGATAAYLTVTSDAADRLLSVRSTLAERAELHETTTDADGLTSMQPVAQGAPINPGAPLVLQPGGLHIMLFNLAHDVPEGGAVDLELTFEKAGVVAAAATVGQPGVPAAAAAAGGDHAH